MSELIILGYEDHDSATRAYERVLELQRDFVVDLSGLAVVKVSDDGKQHVDTPGRIVGASAASGAPWGMLFGLLFLVPVFGFAMGGLMGAVSGRLSKSGIDRAFRDRVQAMLEPGKAAVVVMARKITEDKFAAALAPFGGTVLQTSLSEADEQELAADLSSPEA